MNLESLSKELKSKFDLENPRYLLDENIVCHTYDFKSEVSFQTDIEKELNGLNIDGAKLETGEKENQNFRFAVFAPVQNENFSEAIIMLHGLNERSWCKYLPWAYQLANQTKKPVILFPIAYHINRSPNEWIYPRVMNKFSVFRKIEFPSVENSTFLNAAISMRVDNNPKLFVLSGIQTYYDIVKLSSGIKAGEFDLFKKDCKIDFFGYSIGALLTQTLLISNPLKLFSESKAFFFCGGSTFDKIDGNSRSIMDSEAFSNLRNYLLYNKVSIKNMINLPNHNTRLFKKGWKAFLAMSGIEKYVVQRKNAFKHLIDRVKAVGLKKDCVISGFAIKETLQTNLKNKPKYFDVDILDFQHTYSHEVPFPVINHKINDLVNKSFVLLFDKAARFLQ